MSQLIKKTPFFPTFPTFFDDFVSKDLYNWYDNSFARMDSTLPSVNLKETEKEYKIELAAPGMKKNDFNIALHNGILTIKSEKEEEKEDKDKEGNFLRREFSYESFSRSFTMPENVKEEAISAEYHDGILSIVINKKEPKPVITPKAIKVK